MHRVICKPAVLAAALTAAAVSPARAQVEFTPLGSLPDATFSEAIAVADDGQTVVGWVSLPGERTRSFRWTPGEGMTLLGDPQRYPFPDDAWDISADGAVIVGLASAQPGFRSGFRMEEDRVRLLRSLPGGSKSMLAFCVSADGSVIGGGAIDRSGALAAVRWVDGKIERLVAPGSTDDYVPSSAVVMSADGSVIAGLGRSSRGKEAFVWDRGELIRLGDLPGGKFESGAYGVSADGRVVVGQGWIGSFNTAPFYWTRQTGMIQLGQIAPGKSAGASAASSGGRRIVGSGLDERRRQRVFVWDPVHGTRALERILEDVYHFPLDGWRLDRGSDITADGTVIVGGGVNPLGVREAFLVRIPPFCYADCDGDGELTFFDFLCFQARFATADRLYADCDSDGELTIFDLLCFQNEFAAGCP